MEPSEHSYVTAASMGLEKRMRLPPNDMQTMNETLNMFNQTIDPFDYLEMDINFSSLPYIGNLEGSPSWEVGLKAWFYILSIVLALVGNLTVIFIVWRTKRLQTTTNFYLVNLAVADLMVAACCSWVHLVNDVTEGWVLGAFFCKINSFTQVMSLVAGILTLTLISCDRFFGIVFAMKAHLTERRASTCILIVWILAALVSSPLLNHRRQFMRQWMNHTEIWCDDSWPAVYQTDANGIPIRLMYPSRIAYYTAVSVVLFFLPIVIMTIAYSFIIIKLWSKRAPGERIESGTLAQKRVKRKVIIMLVILLAVFVICWLPLQCAILYAEYIINFNSSELPHWYSAFHYAATFIANSNSAINPIIYTGFNENFRRGFWALFHVDKTGVTRVSISWRAGDSCTATYPGPISTSNTVVSKV